MIQRRILPCDTRNGSFVGGEGRLQAAHLSGPRSDPDAASSGPNLKAPGSAGGYLLVRFTFSELIEIIAAGRSKVELLEAFSAMVENRVP